MSRLKEDFSLAGEPVGTISDAHALADADVLLGALGMADPLGAALWRAKYKGDPRARRQAVALIAHRLATDHRWSLRAAVRARSRRAGQASEPSLPGGMVERVAFRVLHEWLTDRCTRCHGRGSLGQWGSVVRCKRCSGSQREPVQHAARAKDLGVTREAYLKHWEPLLNRVLTLLESIDNGVVGVLRGQMRTATFHPDAAAPEAVSAESCKRLEAHGQPAGQKESTKGEGPAPRPSSKAQCVREAAALADRKSPEEHPASEVAP